jgi:hypothetical protein
MLAEGQEPMPEEPTPAEDEEGSKFTVAPLVGFYSLSSRMPTVGENYKINSDPSYGVAFVWAQSHKKRFRTAIHASVDQRKFLPSIGRTLAERDQTIWGLGLEAGYRFNSWLELVGDVAAKHELFLKRVDGLSLSIERVVIPQASLGFDFLLLDLDGTKLKAGARGHFFYERIGSTATAFSAKSGFGFSQSVSITRPFARHFSLGLSYLHLQRDQDTKISEQSEDLNKVFFNVTFSI